MSLIASVIVTLCAIFPTWVVGIALSVVAFVLLLIVIKIVGFILEAVPFL